MGVDGASLSEPLHERVRVHRSSPRVLEKAGDYDRAAPDLIILAGGDSIRRGGIQRAFRHVQQTLTEQNVVVRRRVRFAKHRQHRAGHSRVDRHRAVDRQRQFRGDLVAAFGGWNPGASAGISSVSRQPTMRLPASRK